MTWYWWLLSAASIIALIHLCGRETRADDDRPAYLDELASLHGEDLPSDLERFGQWVPDEPDSYDYGEGGGAETAAGE